MGRCVHCGGKAGFGARMHPRCEEPFRRRVLKNYAWISPVVELARPNCLTCGHPRLAQEVVFACRGVPHDRPRHGMAYHHQVLSRCPECGHGQLEKADHDCFDLFDGGDLYGWFVLPSADMDRLREVLFPPLAEDPRITVPDLAPQVAQLELRIWSGGGVLPRYVDRATIAKHVARVRARWEDEAPSFVPDDGNGHR